MISEFPEITDNADGRPVARLPAPILAVLTGLVAVACLLCPVMFVLPAWGLMWSLAAFLFFAAKAMLLVIFSGRDKTMSALDWFAFTFAWPGMDLPGFLKQARPAVGDVRGLCFSGCLNIACGFVLWFAAARMEVSPFLATWVAMAGLIFVMHFGVFDLLTAFWRSRGRTVSRLMRCPVAAETVGEFWGRRWNVAFRDLAYPLVFAPVRRRWGARAALWAGFLFSGLLHESVISVPASAGYGLPLAYFSIQALGVWLERRLNFRCPHRRRAFTLLVVAVPVGLVFHSPFVIGVMEPFFKFIGVLS